MYICYTTRLPVGSVSKVMQDFHYQPYYNTTTSLCTSPVAQALPVFKAALQADESATANIQRLVSRPFLWGGVFVVVLARLLVCGAL